MRAPIRRRLFSLLLLLALGISSAMAGERAKDPEWWAVQKKLTNMLSSGETSVATLAGKMKATPPTNAEQAMLQVAVFMRAGMAKECVAAITDLKEHSPNLRNYAVSCMYYEACDHAQAWDVARVLVEVFAGNITELSLENRLFKALQGEGWDFDRFDAWLRKRPAGKKNFWTKTRLRLHMQHKRGDALLTKWAADVKANPSDCAKAIGFLDAILYACHRPEDRPDLNWMADVIKVSRATDAREMGSRLKRLQQWRAGAHFFEQAVKVPLTKEEIRKQSMNYQVFISGERIRVGFEAHVRDELAACLLKQGQTGTAQKWMEDANALREKHGLSRNSYFAGQVQAESGQRVIEKKIKKEEELSKDNPEYWRKRARYYRGRREAAQEEEALKKALALVAPKAQPDRPSKGMVAMRSWIIGDYVHFLIRQKRRDEAVALLRSEIKNAPPNSISSRQAANRLAFDLPKHLNSDDEVLWTWLAAQGKWEHIEERVLLRMLENAPAAARDKHFTRAERLAGEKNPSRLHTLGWIMNRMGHAKRSIPLLEAALKCAEETKGKLLPERAAFTLFESYLDTNNWRKAEALFPKARRRLTAKEVTDWHGRVAMAASRAGAKDEALRIWKNAASANPSALSNLDQLASTGLRGELRKYYLQLKKDLPGSTVPDKALAILNRR